MTLAMIKVTVKEKTPICHVTAKPIVTKVLVTKGNLGRQGVPGKSAYELAVINDGFTGTLQEWLDGFKKTWFDYVVGAQDSETIDETAEYEIEKLIFPNNRFFYRKSTDTTDAIYGDAACTVLVVDRVQNL